jgi:hypothetical protein
LSGEEQVCITAADSSDWAIAFQFSSTARPCTRALSLTGWMSTRTTSPADFGPSTERRIGSTRLGAVISTISSVPTPTNGKCASPSTKRVRGMECPTILCERWSSLRTTATAPVIPVTCTVREPVGGATSFSGVVPA